MPLRLVLLLVPVAPVFLFFGPAPQIETDGFMNWFNGYDVRGGAAELSPGGWPQETGTRLHVKVRSSLAGGDGGGGPTPEVTEIIEAGEEDNVDAHSSEPISNSSSSSGSISGSDSSGSSGSRSSSSGSSATSGSPTVTEGDGATGIGAEGVSTKLKDKTRKRKKDRAVGGQGAGGGGGFGVVAPWRRTKTTGAEEALMANKKHSQKTTKRKRGGEKEEQKQKRESDLAGVASSGGEDGGEAKRRRRRHGSENNAAADGSLSSPSPATNDGLADGPLGGSSAFVSPGRFLLRGPRRAVDSWKRHSKTLRAVAEHGARTLLLQRARLRAQVSALF